MNDPTLGGQALMALIVVIVWRLIEAVWPRPQLAVLQARITVLEGQTEKRRMSLVRMQKLATTLHRLARKEAERTAAPGSLTHNAALEQLALFQNETTRLLSIEEALLNPAGDVG